MPLTRFERTRILSARSLQLALGAPPLAKFKKGMSVFDVAKKEFEEKIIPLIVVRTYPDGRVEKIGVD